MAVSRLEYLFKGYVRHSLSQIEEAELMELLGRSQNEKEIHRLIDKLIEGTEPGISMPDQVAAAMVKNIMRRGNVVSFSRHRNSVNRWMRYAAAAVLILCISGGTYSLLTQANTHQLAGVPSEDTTPIRPGGNHAILTMSGGKIFVLDSVHNGYLQQGNFSIKKQNGVLVFNKGAMPATETYSTLSTPRGGQYKVILSDGSAVWLNASSTLQFPSVFAGNKREVELTGEACFEVAQDHTKPFYVKVGDMQIEVLGTSFNVNAYADGGAVKTSLLEGSIKIEKGGVSGLLKPGEQGVMEKDGDEISLKKKPVDVDEVVAWKNGLFQFNGAGIKTIMQEISRWYDVEIVYSGKVPDRSFEGKISREAQLTEVLKILELSDVKFHVEGRKIIVE
jgi:hypothetical protein